MWDKKELLLAAVIFTAGCCRVNGATAKLDMAEDAFDDRYDGCRKEGVKKFINSGLLGEELKKNVPFQNAWERNPKCLRPIPGGEKEHSTALSVYGHGDENFIKEFNSLVKTGGNLSTYENDFHYKAFHFLLMDALMLLRSNNCKNVSYISDEVHTKKGSKVRLGTFNTGYLNYTSCKKSVDLDDTTVINVYSCFFVNLEDNSCTKGMALLSPAEVFTVEDVKAVKEGDAEYTEIFLKHSGVLSNHNCYLLSRSPANVSTKWLVSLFVALPLVFIYF